MKNCFFIVFILISAAALYSCSKNAAKVHGPQTLPGSWEARSWYGGYSATGGGNFEPGNGNIYAFNDDRYVYYTEGVSSDSGTYKITTATNPNTGEQMPAIEFRGNTDNPICYSINDDTLTLYFGSVAADGTIRKYVRIANAGQTALDHN